MAIETKTITICRCDLCKKNVTNEKQLKTLKVPVKFLTEQTEGRSCKPYFTFPQMDLCVECLEKITMVLGQGAQGYNEYRIRKGDYN